MGAIHGEAATVFQVPLKKYFAGWNNSTLTRHILTLKTIFQQNLTKVFDIAVEYVSIQLSS